MIWFSQVMSPTNKSSSTMPGKPKSSSSSGRNPRCGGVKPIDFDASRYDNAAMKIFLVVSGNPKMSMAFTPYTIPANSFISGTQHGSVHTAVKQAVYNALANSLSRIFPLEKEVKEGLMELVTMFYSEKSIGAETFRFSTKKNPAALFNFTALSKFVLASNDDTNKDALCFCPPAFVEAIWDLTDSILADKPSNDVVERNLPFHSPNIRTAFNLYPNLPEDSLIKTFSQSCFMDPFGAKASPAAA